MKTIYITALMVMMVLMLILPLSANADIKDTTISDSAQQVISPVDKLENSPEEVKVKLKLTATGEIVTYSAEDYIFGVVAAEMPALYETEALKAQAVAAYTYYLKKAAASDGEYDITDDYSVDQAFITPEKAGEKWGDDAEKYEKKIRDAVKSVLYKRICYGGEPISAVYHAISSGKTEKAADIWGGEYPYLVSVDSSFDKLSENYLSNEDFTTDELKKALSALVTVTEAEGNGIADIKRSDSGSVTSLTVWGKTLDGLEFRKALGLRSSNFDIEFKDGVYTFTVRGYGHGIGMSQNGANYLAQQGKSFEEILLYYYTGCSIE